MPEEHIGVNWTTISTADKATLTISTGDITPVTRFVIVAAQTGTTDDLDGIVTSSIPTPSDADGAVIYLMADAGDTITIRHNQNAAATKNILTDTGSSVTLTGNTVIRILYNIALDTNGAWAVSEVVAGTTTIAGKLELATTAEIDTGTDSTRAMPVDQFVASDRNIRFITIRLVEAATDVAVATTVGGDWVCPFTGTLLQSDTDINFLSANTDTAGTTGAMVVDIHKGGTTVMTTNKLDIESAEKSTNTATTQPDLTTTAVTAGDVFTFDVDAIHTTAAKGLSVTMAIRMT